MKSQSEMILDYLKSGARLTVLEALQRFNCYALSQRIGEMKRSGYPIESRMIEVESGKHVAEYWMKQ
jgi:hypothetical protein